MDFDMCSSRGEKKPSACRVCASVSAYGLRFGVYSCEACSVFFKRQIGVKKTWTCVNGTNNCYNNRGPNDVRGGTGKCPACRYKKCLEVGMNINAKGTHYHRVQLKQHDSLVGEMRKIEKKKVEKSPKRMKEVKPQLFHYEKPPPNVIVLEPQRHREEPRCIIVPNSSRTSIPRPPPPPPPHRHRTPPPPPPVEARPQSEVKPPTHRPSRQLHTGFTEIHHFDPTPRVQLPIVYTETPHSSMLITPPLDFKRLVDNLGVGLRSIEETRLAIYQEVGGSSRHRLMVEMLSKETRLLNTFLLNQTFFHEIQKIYHSPLEETFGNVALLFNLAVAGLKKGSTQMANHGLHVLPDSRHICLKDLYIFYEEFGVHAHAIADSTSTFHNHFLHEVIGMLRQMHLEDQEIALLLVVVLINELPPDHLYVMFLHEFTQKEILQLCGGNVNLAALKMEDFAVFVLVFRQALQLWKHRDGVLSIHSAIRLQLQQPFSLH